MKDVAVTVFFSYLYSTNKMQISKQISGLSNFIVCKKFTAGTLLWLLAFVILKKSQAQHHPSSKRSSKLIYLKIYKTILKDQPKALRCKQISLSITDQIISYAKYELSYKNRMQPKKLRVSSMLEKLFEKKKSIQANYS